MCFGTGGSSKERQVEAYRVPRLDDRTLVGEHIRRRSSVERHLRVAPNPQPRPNGKRYPHRYNNTDVPRCFDTNEELTEYPTMDFPYAQQNAKGKGRRTSPGGTIRQIDPGYTRTITNNGKEIKGLIHHPPDSQKKFVRTEEIYAKPRRRRCQ